MSAPTSLEAGDGVKMGPWEQREAEALEELVIAWRAENPGIAGEIVFEAGQRPRVQRASPMTQNRAALPKPPAYARGRTEEQQKALDLLSFDRLPATAVPALFAQLREMGVGCNGCKYGVDPGLWVHTFCGQMDEVSPEFLCSDWEAGE